MQSTILQQKRKELSQRIQSLDVSIGEMHSRRGKFEAQLELVEELLKDIEGASGTTEKEAVKLAATTTISLSPPPIRIDPTHDNQAGRLKAAIYEALKSFGDVAFSKKSLVMAIQLEHPEFHFNPKSLDKYLSQMVEQKEIQIHHQGIGRFPNIYSVVTGDKSLLL